MKKYLVLGLLLCFGFAGLSAQAANASEEQPGNEIYNFDLRFLSENLELTMNQIKILKTYYGDNHTEMYNDLRPVTDAAQRFVIENNYLVMRDEKLRSILTEEQLAIYNTLTPPAEPVELSTLENTGGR